MLDAVNGELGRFFAGQGDVTLYGISNARSAGKTGTAQLGGEQAPHSWFIGFAPAEADATPADRRRCAGRVGRLGRRPRSADRRPGHGRVASPFGPVGVTGAEISGRVQHQAAIYH